LLQVDQAHRLLRAGLGLGQRGQKQSGYNGDDGNDHQQLNERKAADAFGSFILNINPIHRFIFSFSCYDLMSETLRICDINKTGLFVLFCNLIVTSTPFACNLIMDNPRCKKWSSKEFISKN
jgi:hypothetical protein